jgi:hypothetical protein
MSIESALYRFILAYLLFKLVLGFIASTLSISTTLPGIAALLGAAYWACHVFSKSNGRFFTRTERKRFNIGVVLFYACLQVTIGVPYLAYSLNLNAANLMPVIVSTFLVTVVVVCVCTIFLGKVEKYLVTSGVVGEGSGEGDVAELPETNTIAKFFGRGSLLLGTLLMLLIVPVAIVKLLSA